MLSVRVWSEIVEDQPTEAVAETLQARVMRPVHVDCGLPRRRVQSCASSHSARPHTRQHVPCRPTSIRSRFFVPRCSLPYHHRLVTTAFSPPPSTTATTALPPWSCRHRLVAPWRLRAFASSSCSGSCSGSCTGSCSCRCRCSFTENGSRIRNGRSRRSGSRSNSRSRFRAALRRCLCLTSPYGQAVRTAHAVQLNRDRSAARRSSVGVGGAASGGGSGAVAAAT